MDTGSANVWVYGSNAPTSHNKFNPTGSSTVALSNTPWYIAYGSGEEEGLLARDIMAVAGLVVPQQVFGLANQSTSIFEGLPIDGVMGALPFFCSSFPLPTLSRTNAK